MATSFDGLILAHPGTRICVMGGGPSLADDLARIKADVYISANEHGVPGCDYIVAMDVTHGGNKRKMREYLKSLSDAPILGPADASPDYVLYDWPGYPARLHSGVVALWVAWMMGAEVVITAGMDAYNGEKRALRKVQTMAPEIRCPVRAVSGPLVEIFGQYDPAEGFGEYRPHPSIEARKGIDNEAHVRVRKPTNIAGERLDIGAEWIGPRHMIKRLLKNKVVVEL